ncbi:MAG: ATP-binding protein [bacterium]
MFKRFVVIGFLLVIIFALVDVLTKWSLENPILLGILIALGVLHVYLERRSRAVVIVASLATVCFAIHLITLARVENAVSRWDEIREKEVIQAIDSSEEFLVSAVEGLLSTSERVAKAQDWGEFIRSDRRNLFILLDRMQSGLLSAQTGGLAIADSIGEIISWAGRIPNSLDRLTLSESQRIYIRKGSGIAWFEAVSPILDKTQVIGYSIAYLEIEDLLRPGESDASDLARRLRKQVDYPVTFSTEKLKQDIGDSWLISEVRMPSGELLGYLKLRSPTVENYLNSTKIHGLFLASLFALVLMVTCFVAILRWAGLIRPRMINNQRLAAILASIAGLRIGLAGLRDNLALERLQAFSPMDYATQIPTGILRSPADLALTGIAVGVAVIVLLLVTQQRGIKGLFANHKPSLVIIYWLSLGGVGSVLVAFASKGLPVIHSDLGVDLFPHKAFDISSISLFRIGLAGLVIGLLTIPGILMREQMLLLRKTRFEKFPILLGLVMSCHFAIALAVTKGRLTGGGVLISLLAIAFAVLLYQQLKRQIKIPFIWILVGLVTAASLVELPYGIIEHKRKSRIAAEAIASRIIYQTREWKSSLIERASSEIESDRGIADLMASFKEGSQQVAINLWKKSVINRARVRGGIYVFSRADQIIDRFAPYEVGDISGLDAIIRRARLNMKRITEITEISIGRKSMLSYVSVIPFYKDLEYVGSVAIVIPEKYDFLVSEGGSYEGLLSVFPIASATSVRAEGGFQRIDLSVIIEGKVAATTSADIEIGRLIYEDDMDLRVGEWFDREFSGKNYRCCLVEPEGVDHSVLLSFRTPTAIENVVYGMASLVSYLLIATFLIAVIGLWQLIRLALRKTSSGHQLDFRVGFTQKVALALVVVAVIPALILGSASRGFIRARLKEVMESKAQEGINLARMALERVSREDAERFAENPILMEALKEEPSLIVNLVKPGTSAIVFDSTANLVAAYGNPSISNQTVRDVISDGKTYNFFSSDNGLTAKSIFPIRDSIKPSRIIGCAFVSRAIDDRLARQIAVEIGRQIDFFTTKRLVASSSREYFALELINDRISPDAYVNCFLAGRDLSFSWQRVNGVDLVAAYSLLRDYDGSPIGAISAPLVFEKDAMGIRMESTLATISHLVVIVIWGVFLFGMVLAKKISRPIRELIKGTMMVRAGNLDFTIPRQGDDEIADLISSFNDMTQALQKSRKALKERKRYIETIIANVGAGIISVDSRGRIEMVNPAAENLLGIKEKDARHKDCIRFLTKIGAGGLADVLRDVSDRKESAVQEVIIQIDNRSRIFRAVGSSVAAVRGRAMGRVIVFEDLTDLIKAKKLVAWNEMARQVAHEIKNPLTPMKLSIQHLIQCHRDRVENLDKIVEETSQTIIDQIEALRKIALEFSRFSRLPERNLELVDINSIVKDVLKQYEGISSEGIDIEINLNQSLPSIRVDREEIKRLLINIVENAIDAMKNGGNLTVKTGLASAPRMQMHAFKISSRGEPVPGLNRYIEVEISDTGIGIDQQSLGHIFEPNFSTKTKGAGLGLAICKGVVDGYDGEIVIETTPKKGTTVRIRLPYEKVTEQIQAQNTGNRKKHHYPQR